MPTVRQPAVAGRFYPADAADLRALVRDAVNAGGLDVETDSTACVSSAPKAIIAPHAGYVYSGAVAGTAYARLGALRNVVKRVVLLGPAHFVKFDGLALAGVDEFETPLGRIPSDSEAVQKILELPFVNPLYEAHAREHSLEVHLPFLQETLADFRLVALAVGSADVAQVAEVVETLWGGRETLFVISSDLSHFHSYEEAVRLDAETSRNVESFAVDELNGKRACGHLGIRGLLTAARSREMRVRTVDLRNSGDFGGDPGRVVGYGAYIVERRDERRDAPFDVDVVLSEDDRSTLLEVARRSIRDWLEHESPTDVDADAASQALKQTRASFVTLRIAGELRGCMGSLAAREPLISDVARNAWSAANRDPRFDPVATDEFDRLAVSISVLTRPTPIEFVDERDLLRKIRPGEDGLLLTHGSRRGTLLPAVWKNIRDPEQFLSVLKRKAGLADDDWPDSVTIERYGAESFGD